ncbi:hypothetical protein NPS01_42620 [Nocardioides psychrotolerans]|uniref:Transcriptional regulator, AlpA family n=1 Tax=Nocardioides psychrotolerans TaxID=1005945 RepID=A0A1I3MC27_9ACTN|nr:helix-turn-helix domain-containing protein [Nocardioides psychrotolerans]GEP40599.1 hypothetical protein NPS01_42620 [Nocardioides psychrotolerans]SFI94538.1 transcriptional regulator, AlpA family [Nocardioides psychrotolerans]
MADSLLDIEEVSARTTVPVGTLRYWRHLGTTGPRSTRIGRRVVYRESEVEAWIEAQFANAVGDDLQAAGQ